MLEVMNDVEGQSQEQRAPNEWPVRSRERFKQSHVTVIGYVSSSCTFPEVVSHSFDTWDSHG
jgi:hypothetical protein